MKKKAFTLVEIMAVVALITVLFIVFIPRIGFAVNKTKVVGVQTDFRGYETALQSTAVENSTLTGITKPQATTPEKSKALASKVNEYLDPALQIKADEFGVLSTDKKDPWGTPYTVGYSEPDDAIYLYSLGADKRPGKEYKHVPTEAVGDDLVLVQKDNILYTYGFPVNSKNDNKPNSPVVMTGLTITKAPIKLVYQIGENFDISGMEVKASYSNGTEGMITDFTVTDGANMAAGKSVVTISYTEEEVTKTALQSIEVKNPLVSIKIGAEPAKKNYIVGENFDPVGMVVVATYTNGSTAPVLGYTVTGGENLTIGAKWVTVSFSEDGVTQTVLQPIAVTNPLVSIAVTKAPTKTAYIAGENFNPVGMEVTATYTNGSTRTVSGTVTDGTSLADGKKSVTISYTEGTVTTTTTQAITVTNPLASIAITKAPTKTAYIAGESFNSVGMVVTATYMNKDAKVVTEYTVTDGANLAVGKRTVTISFTEDGVTKTALQPITVTNPLASISITKAPTDTAYTSGENFSSAGMEVTAAYTNGAKKVVTGWTVSNGSNLKFECKSVSVSYEESGISKTTSQNITMKASENETVFTFSNGTTQTVGVVGKLSESSYVVPQGINLIRVTVGRHVTAIDNYAFEGCTSLASVDVPSSVTTIGSLAFYKCTSLISVNLSNSVKAIGVQAFYGCTSLTLATIPNSVTEIGDSAFRSCSSLTSIDIPSSVTTIKDGVFNGCTSLTSVFIPNSVTAIGNCAFYSCTSLTSVTIPSSVAAIEWNAFGDVPHIEYHGTATGSPWGARSVN